MPSSDPINQLESAISITPDENTAGPIYQQLRYPLDPVSQKVLLWFLNQWNFKPRSEYIGHVKSNGTIGDFFPAGWSVAHTATGVYTITHTLPPPSTGVTQNYSVTFAPCATAIAFMTYTRNATNTTFIVKTYNSSAAATDTEFTFTVTI